MSLSRVDAVSPRALQNSLPHDQSNAMNPAAFPVLPMTTDHSAWKTLVGPMAGLIAYLGAVKERAPDTPPATWQTVSNEFNVRYAVLILILNL